MSDGVQAQLIVPQCYAGVLYVELREAVHKGQVSLATSLCYLA